MTYTATGARTRVNVEALQRERERRGWTLARLAEAADIDRRTLWEVQRTRSATPAVFAKLAAALARHEPLAYADELRRAG